MKQIKTKSIGQTILRLFYLISTLLFLSGPVYAQATVQNSSEKSAKVAQAKEILERCKTEHDTRKQTPRTQQKQTPRTQQSVVEENGAITNCLLRNLQNSSTQNSQNKRIKKTELKFAIDEINDEFGTSVEFDAVIPLWEKGPEGQESTLFLQPGFILSVQEIGTEEREDTSEKTQQAASLGVVYRFVVTGGIIGLNVFYDHNLIKDENKNFSDKTFDHGRASIGADYQDQNNYVSFNYYLPEDKWTSISLFQEQRAAGAYDLHFERTLSSKWAALANITYIDYEETDPNTLYSVGAEYKLSCSTKLGAAVNYDDKTEKTGGTLSLVFSIGGSRNKNSKDCYQAEDQSDLYRVTQREKKVHLENRRRRNINLRFILPTDTTRLFADEPDSKQDSDTVIIWNQGGPAGELDEISEPGEHPQYRDNYKTVRLHQMQTLFPEILKLRGGVTVKDLEKIVAQDRDILGRVIKHFKDQNKKVIVMSHSYGSLLTMDYIARKGSTAPDADRYIITAGRLKMQEDVWKWRIKALNEYDKWDLHVHELTPDQQVQRLHIHDFVSRGDPDLSISLQSETFQDQRVAGGLQAAILKNNYINLLAGVDLSKVYFGYGAKDRKIGALTAEEVTFLEARGALVVETPTAADDDDAGNHDSPLSDRAALIAEIEKGRL